MLEIAHRLKEERQRLQMSQSAFAAMVGVHRNTQRKYESGERKPDAGYFTAIGSLGVDSGYVVTGARLNHSPTSPEPGGVIDDLSIRGYDSIHNEPARLMLSILGVPVGTWNDLVQKTVTRLPNGSIFVNDDSPAWRRGLIKRSPVINSLIKDAQTVDADLLAQVLDGIDWVLVNAEIVLTSEKKSRAAAMLYRSFKATGKVDLKMIEEAVKLAAN